MSDDWRERVYCDRITIRQPQEGRGLVNDGVDLWMEIGRHGMWDGSEDGSSDVDSARQTMLYSSMRRACLVLR
jgi:hypothetical protein